MNNGGDHTVDQDECARSCVACFWILAQIKIRSGLLAGFSVTEPNRNLPSFARTARPALQHSALRRRRARPSLMSRTHVGSESSVAIDPEDAHRKKMQLMVGQRLAEYAWKGNAEEMARLLKLKPDVNWRGNDGTTPLQAACQVGMDGWLFHHPTPSPPAPTPTHSELCPSPGAPSC